MTRPALTATRAAWMAAGSLVALALLAGCDDARFEPDPRSAQPSVFQPRTVRSLISPKGLERLYQVEYPEGVRLDYGAEDSQQLGVELSLGPVARDVRVDDWRVESDTDQIDVRLRADNIAVTVPARIAERVGARVCRYLVEADRVEVQAQAALVDDDQTPMIEATGAPTVTMSNPRATRVGDCPPLQSAEQQDHQQVEQLFVGYLRRAFAESTRAALHVSPLDSLGLVHSTVGLARVSNFANRRGALTLSGRLAPNNGSELSGRGLNMDLDMALGSKRASCAPALTAEAPSTLSADEVPASELARTDADVGLTLAAPLLARLAQTSALGGFTCRGLETPDFDGGGTNLATDDLALEEVGLGGLPVGAWAEPVLVPGALPELTTDPANGALQLQWNDLSVDFYARMQGVPVRILQLTVGVVLTLRPVEQADGVDLAVDAVLVTDTDLQSQWLYERPFDTDLLLWSKRVMLLVLDGAFSLPLPVEPGAPLHLVESQVRNNDLLLLMDFDRVF